MQVFWYIFIYSWFLEMPWGNVLPFWLPAPATGCCPSCGGWTGTEYVRINCRLYVVILCIFMAGTRQTSLLPCSSTSLPLLLGNSNAQKECNIKHFPLYFPYGRNYADLNVFTSLREEPYAIKNRFVPDIWLGKLIKIKNSFYR